MGSRVVPSDVVRFVDATFPAASSGGAFKLKFVDAQKLGALLQLVDHLDDALLPPDGDDYACYLVSIGALETVQTMWTTLGVMAAAFVETTPGFEGNPVAHIRRILAARPDAHVSVDTDELSFISDETLRLDLRSDVGSVGAALEALLWKPAMVLAGSVMEALLLNAMGDPVKVKSAFQELAKKGTISDKEPNPTRWHLRQLTLIAAHLGVIRDATCQPVLIAGDFRNLIHPGKAMREGNKATRGAAQIAAGAMHLVIEDLRKPR